MEPWPSCKLGKAAKAVWAQGRALGARSEVRSDILSEGNSFRAPQRFFPPRSPPHKDFGGGSKAERGRSVPKTQYSPTPFLLYPQKTIKSQSYWGGPGKSNGSSSGHRGQKTRDASALWSCTHWGVSCPCTSLVRASVYSSVKQLRCPCYVPQVPRGTQRSKLGESQKALPPQDR